MPPKVKVTKEDIVSASVDIIRRYGAEGLNARSIADKLGCSTQPIYSNYSTMEKLKADVIEYAGAIHQEYNKRAVKDADYPAYKAIGMYYIRFAKEERELFKLLFMRDRSKEKMQINKEEFADIIDLISQSIGISKDEAYLFHTEMWIYVHGIAVMIVTSFLDWDTETISQMLTDIYQGLKITYQNRRTNK